MCTAIGDAMKLPFKTHAKLQDKLSLSNYYLRKQGWSGNGFTPGMMLQAKIGGVETSTQKASRETAPAVIQQRVSSGNEGPGGRPAGIRPVSGR